MMHLKAKKIKLAETVVKLQEMPLFEMMRLNEKLLFTARLGARAH